MKKSYQARAVKSTPSSTLLHHLPLLLLLLPLQKFPLLLSRHTTQQPLTLFLLELLGGIFALFGFLFFVCAAQFADFFFTGVAQFAGYFGTPVGAGDEGVGETEEVAVERQSGCVTVGGDCERELDTFLGDGFFDSVYR
jgi:hypothetical protein